MPFITFEWVKGAIVSEKNEGSEHQLHIVRVMEHYLWVSGQQQDPQATSKHGRD